MVGWGSRKEKTQIHEETDSDATDSDPRECVWVCRRGADGWVGVCVILCSVFLLPSKWRWLSSRCRTDSCCHTHTTCQLSWSDNVLFNEANWETSQYAAVSVCVCTDVCPEHPLLAGDNKWELKPKKKKKEWKKKKNPFRTSRAPPTDRGAGRSHQPRALDTEISSY